MSDVLAALEGTIPRAGRKEARARSEKAVKEVLDRHLPSGVSDSRKTDYARRLVQLQGERVHPVERKEILTILLPFMERGESVTRDHLRTLSDLALRG